MSQFTVSGLTQAGYGMLGENSHPYHTVIREEVVPLVAPRLREQLASGHTFNVSVEMEWNVTVGGMPRSFYVNLIPFTLQFQGVMNVDNPNALVPIGDMAQYLTSRVDMRIEIALERESDIVFQGITEVSFLMVPTARTRQVMRNTQGGGKGVVIPKGLAAKKCCVNVGNDDL